MRRRLGGEVEVRWVRERKWLVGGFGCNGLGTMLGTAIPGGTVAEFPRYLFGNPFVPLKNWSVVRG